MNKQTLTVIISLLVINFLYGYANNPPNGRTGAPGENTCATASCHSSYDLNSGPGDLSISGPITYTPYEILTFVINITHNDQERWGFELCARDIELDQAGNIIIIDESITQSSVSSGITYLKQTNSGTFDGQLDNAHWEFQWQAPNSDIGEVTFYFTGNAANGNNNRLGDYIYATDFTIQYAEEGCIPDGDVNLDGELNVLDIVSTVGFILDTADFTDEQFCIGDINEDMDINVLDIVTMVNNILNP